MYKGYILSFDRIGIYTQDSFTPENTFDNKNLILMLNYLLQYLHFV